MRKLATFSLAFSAGVCLAQYLLPHPWLLPCAAVCLLLGWTALLLPSSARKRLILIAAGLSLAFGWDWLYIRQVQKPMLALEGIDVPVRMEACSYAIPTSYGAKVTVKLNSFTGGKAVYYGNKDLLTIRPGQSIQDLVHFESALRIKDDDVTTFTSKGAFLLAYQRGIPSYEEGSAGSTRWWPLRLGHAMQAKIPELFDGDVAAFMTAILTGDKHLLSEQASADLSEAGLYHILAVSGMHCGFLLTMVALLTGRHRRKLVAFLAIPLLLFYAALAGGSPSVLRACMMLILLLLAPLFNRDSDGLTSLSFALLLILLQNPFSVASVSLQLSFGAMGGILLVTPRLFSLLQNGKHHGKCYSFIAAGISSTAGALVFTAPLSALYFNSLVLISPLSNLLCLWAASLIFMLGLLAVLVSLFTSIFSGILGLLPMLLIRYILGTSHLLAAIPYHAVYFSNPYLFLWLIFLYVLLAAAFLLHSSKPRRTALLVSSISVTTLILSTLLGFWRYHSALDAFVLDVGQGQSVLLASDGAFALLDCGSASHSIHAGEMASEQLQSMGCHRLDYLLLTHYDFDHISGVEGLLARLPVGTLLLPEDEDDAGLRNDILAAAATYGVPVREMTDSKQFPLGTATLQVYPPVGEDADNERGLACLASVGSYDLLITGDMSSQTERKLLETYTLPDIEAMVVGHHGSKFSTSEELLTALHPEIACISAGKNNRYGHPAVETLRRLAEHGCSIYRTDIQGTIHLTFNQGDSYGIQEKRTPCQ